jgi:hypothetical protein
VIQYNSDSHQVEDEPERELRKDRSQDNPYRSNLFRHTQMLESTMRLEHESRKLSKMFENQVSQKSWFPTSANNQGNSTNNPTRTFMAQGNQSFVLNSKTNSNFKSQRKKIYT